MPAHLVKLLEALHSQDGQDLIEYALIIGLLVVVAIVGLNLLGTQISEIWNTISTWLNGVAQTINV